MKKNVAGRKNPQLADRGSLRSSTRGAMADRHAGVEHYKTEAGESAVEGQIAPFETAGQQGRDCCGSGLTENFTTMESSTDAGSTLLMSATG